MSCIPHTVIVRSSYLSELDGIKEALKENNEVAGVKKLFLRKDLLRKVKQYDGKLSDVLLTFQVRCLFSAGAFLLTYRLKARLSMDARFAQLADGRKVCTLPILANHDRLTSSIGHS
jgi:hypothetical protein